MIEITRPKLFCQKCGENTLSYTQVKMTEKLNEEEAAIRNPEERTFITYTCKSCYHVNLGRLQEFSKDSVEDFIKGTSAIESNG